MWAGSARVVCSWPGGQDSRGKRANVFSGQLEEIPDSPGFFFRLDYQLGKCQLALIYDGSFSIFVTVF